MSRTEGQSVTAHTPHSPVGVNPRFLSFSSNLLHGVSLASLGVSALLATLVFNEPHSLTQSLTAQTLTILYNS